MQRSFTYDSHLSLSLLPLAGFNKAQAIDAIYGARLYPGLTVPMDDESFTYTLEVPRSHPPAAAAAATKGASSSSASAAASAASASASQIAVLQPVLDVPDVTWWDAEEAQVSGNTVLSQRHHVTRCFALHNALQPSPLTACDFPYISSPLT